MSAHLAAWAVMTLLLATSPSVADEAPLLTDLTAVIALHGQPCGQVVSAVRRGESDYVASCADGKRYRVFTNEKGRVVVARQ